MLKIVSVFVTAFLLFMMATPNGASRCESAAQAGLEGSRYKCEADCVVMSMCWDDVSKTCHCRDGKCANATMPDEFTRCDQTYYCNPENKTRSMIDQKDCGGFFVCIHQYLDYQKCPISLAFNEKTDMCDYEDNIPGVCINSGPPGRTFPIGSYE